MTQTRLQRTPHHLISQRELDQGPEFAGGTGAQEDELIRREQGEDQAAWKRLWRRATMSQGRKSPQGKRSGKTLPVFAVLCGLVAVVLWIGFLGWLVGRAVLSVL